MQVASFVLALLALVVSALALTWQIASFVLSGRRGKVFLALGGRRGVETLVSSFNRRRPNRRFLESLEAVGFVDPLVAVTVINRGRLPMHVHGVSFEWRRGGSWLPGDDAKFQWPEIPHALEPGQLQTWLVDLRELRRQAERCGRTPRMPVRARVFLGDGTKLATREAVRFRALPNWYGKCCES